MLLSRIFLTILLLAGVCGRVAASPLFDDQAVLEVELVGPMNSVLKSKDEPEDFPFVLRVDGRELPVDVHARGKSRLEHCQFPPLRLDLDRSETGGTAFEGQNMLKLVTHCDNSDSGESNLLEEYLVYRIFNLLSDFSYRVRLLRMHYVDTDDRLTRKARNRYAFVIEPTDELAARLNARALNLEAVSKKKLDTEQITRVYVFQYLVGNTDWSLASPRDSGECCHNGRLVERDEKIFYVPYDFDQTGVVNAPYAKPHPVVRLPNVRARRYRGYCTDPEMLRAAIRHVNLQRDQIIETVRNTPGLEERDADRAVDYLMSYFEKAADEDETLKKFEKQCLGR
jgi:hypothetical protein